MKAKITPRKPGERGGIVCLPLVANVPYPKSEDWKQITCSICGAACWESDLARQVIASGTAAACTMCALKAGVRHDCEGK